MMTPAEDGYGHDLPVGLVLHVFVLPRYPLSQTLVRTSDVEEGPDVLLEDTAKMFLVQDEDVIQTLAAYTAEKSRHNANTQFQKLAADTFGTPKRVL
jgi:hypothetical protein